MSDIKEIKSIVNEKIMNIFYPDYKVNNFSLYDYATWKCGIDGLIHGVLEIFLLESRENFMIVMKL